MKPHEFFLYDVTARDGNHALGHKISPSFLETYCQLAENSNLYAVEVGHGNGLGASSYLVGKSEYTDEELLTAARKQLNKVRLAVHAIPGFATIERDLKPALAAGVDLFRVATHCSEADVAERQIGFLKKQNAEVQGVLMMSHMLPPEKLVGQAIIHQASGADAVVIMDSAGHYGQTEVYERVSLLVESLDVPVGFHAHNNLGLGVANALTAKEAGASFLDGSSMGLGAGAGNAQLEALAANLMDFNSDIDLEMFLKLSEAVSEAWPENLPRITRGSIESALSGAFSGYASQVARVSQELGVERARLWRAIGERKLVAGQESMIREIAVDLMNL
jgi:4-hydroxy 2-oxovalerate aldolase